MLMSDYQWLWVGSAWTMYMIVMVTGYAVWWIGNAIWRWRHG